jgi:hypothetical protein
VEASVRGAASAAILTTQQERAPDGEQRVKRIESQLKNTLDGLRETFKEARERHVPDEIPDCYLVSACGVGSSELAKRARERERGGARQGDGKWRGHAHRVPRRRPSWFRTRVCSLSSLPRWC